MNLRALWVTARRWYDTHSTRDRRVILAVLGAIALSLVYVVGVDPLIRYRRRVGEEIADGQEQLERSARFLGAVDSLRAERDDLRTRLAQAKTHLLPGDSGTLGAAALQEQANSIAAEKGITVQSTQVMREEGADPFRRIAIRLTLSGEIKPFIELVSGLEYGPQELRIPFVEVSRRGAVAGQKGPRTLSGTVEVSGYQMSGGQGQKAKGKEPEATEAEAGQGGAEGEAAADGAEVEPQGGTPTTPPVGPPAPPDLPGPPAPAPEAS